MIRELQEQLNKIMNEFMGSKSHFAKFVELKSENMMLQVFNAILTDTLTCV